MKPVCFVICFTVGVSLMVFSGYLPQSASASGNKSNVATAPGRATVEPTLFERQPITGTVTRKVETGPLNTSSGTSTAEAAVTDVVYTEPAPPVAAHPRTDTASVTGATDRAELAPATPSVPALPSQSQPGSESAAPAPSDPPALPAGEATQAKEEPLVLADAGPDRVVWIGWDELTLDATGSTGDNLTYQWKLISGPPTLVIKNDTAPSTTAAGLLAGEKPQWGNTVCKFELTVSDPSGVQDTTTVRYVVKSAPMLKIKPMAERRFELRDGYQLAHFASWTTNIDSYEAVFEISSETELTFTKVGGSNYSLTGGKGEKNYHYQVTVYGQTGESTAWVELLVDTDERIPGIIQLGVNWEGH